MPGPDEVSLPYVFDEPLVTERLVLRRMSPADVDDVFAYQSRDDVCRYLPFEPRSREQVADKLSQFAAADTLDQDGSYLQLAVQLRAGERPGRVIGDSYFTVASREHGRGEIGWTVHPDFVGRGYALEAATAVLDLAFGTLGLHRVFAELDTRNDASVALCRRLGMRREAHLVEDWWFKGEWADTGVHAVLQQEWRRRRGTAAPAVD